VTDATNPVSPEEFRMRMLKIGQLLINIDHLIEVELNPAIDDYGKVIGSEPNPNADRDGEPTRPVYAKRNMVKISTADRSQARLSFFDAEADAVRAWFLAHAGNVPIGVIDIAPGPASEADEAGVNPVNFREYT
jgi:hypothetical protein